jgi:hypothetical protein
MTGTAYRSRMTGTAYYRPIIVRLRANLVGEVALKRDK